MIGFSALAVCSARMLLMKFTVRSAVTLLVAMLMSCAVQAGFDEGLDALGSRNHAKALAEFKPLAINGNAAAQRMMGRMYDGLFDGLEDLRQIGRASCRERV